MSIIPNLASFLDLANHKSTASEKDILKLCEDVLKYGFNAAFVNPCHVKFAKNHLRGDPPAGGCKHLGGEIIRKPKVGTVISFPLGQETTSMKIASSLEAIKNGADELDICTNIAFLKTCEDQKYFAQLKQIVTSLKKAKPEVIIKFIIEAGYLTPLEIKKASLLVLKSGADFVKTCSGFGPRGTRLDDVKIIKSVIDNKIRIKVAGGIKSLTQVKTYLHAGASRIGTSQAVSIITQQ